MRYTTWRLLPDRCDSAPLNMAIDATLARALADEPAGRRPGEAAAGQRLRPIIRFYHWRNPAVSIGYRQPLSQLNLDACRALGYAVVRRPTGGSAVVHDGGELTYAVALPCSATGPNRPLDVYRTLHAACARGLRRLGISVSTGLRQAGSGSLRPAQAERVPGKSSHAPAACFATLGQDEVEMNGFKVIGSAQRRFASATLQQGSILLRADARTHERLLRNDDQPSPASYLRGLDAFTPAPLNRDELRRAILQGLSEQLHIRFEEEALTAAEERAANALAAQRFRAPAWTARR